MFWAKRLKQADDTTSSWAVSYGDLMTLLVALFVLIAAMSELRPGERFNRMAGGVRKALGFAALAPGSAGMTPRAYPPTLLERLEQAGFARRTRTHLVGPDDATLAACDVVVSDGSVLLRIAGHASFARGSAALDAVANRALRRVAEMLAETTGRIEIRGHSGSEPQVAGTLFRDAMDLSYARGRAVADVLAEQGIARGRLLVTACGDSDPLADPTGPSAARLPALGGLSAATRPTVDLPDAAQGRIEIVVHAASSAGHEHLSPGKD